MEKLMNNEKEYPVYSAEDIEKQKALDAKEKANNWHRLEEKLTSDVGEELAKETVKAFGELYELFEGGAVDWFANLFDAECGGYYYSNSARDTACFRPDLESTYQSLQFMSGSGLGVGISSQREIMPEWAIKGIVKFTKSLQDPENGYFYHPQWGKKMIDARPNRRGRDLTWASRILQRFGEKPTYDTPLGDKGDGKGAEAKSVNSAASLDRDSAVAEHLRTREAFEEYLSKLDVNGDGYTVGNLLESQADQILVRDSVLAERGENYRLADIMTDWLTSKQNPKTGLWTHYDKIDYLGINGLLKIMDAYHRVHKEFPHAVEAFRSAMQILEAPIEPTTVCFVLNPWYAMTSLLDNIEKYNSSEDKEEINRAVTKIRREMLLNAPALIRATIKKLKIFHKPDGSFSYMPRLSGPNSQGLPVAIYGTNEGDVNATYICIVATTSHVFNVLGYKLLPIYYKADRMRYLNILEKNRKNALSV